MKNRFLLLLPLLIITGCNPYGKKLEWVTMGMTLYYPESVSNQKANDLLDFLKDKGYYKGRKEIQLADDKSNYTLKIPIEKGKENDEDLVRLLRFQTCSFPEDFMNMDIALTDERFNTLRTIPNALKKIGKQRTDYDNIILYALPNAPERDIKNLESYLSKKGAMGSRFFQLDFEATQYYKVGFLVKEGINLDDESSKAYFNVLAGELSVEVFNGFPVDMQALDQDFKILRTYPFAQEDKALYQAYGKMKL